MFFYYYIKKKTHGITIFLSVGGIKHVPFLEDSLHLLQGLDLTLV